MSWRVVRLSGRSIVEPLSRPVPPRSFAERARAWIEWFGVARLAAASVATVVVCAGAVWLLRTPPPATETTLPRATTTGVAVPASEPVAAAPAATARVLVHVAGAVVEPGVYELGGDARVRDAIVAAGGPTEIADWNALNLAAAVADGVKVYVPGVGEDVPPSLTVPMPADGGQPTMLIDVNVANADELEALPGVGPATATAIVTERERNGPFLDVDDLDRVPGIGPAKLDALRDLVVT
jgi:competence protein ComEA